MTVSRYRTLEDARRALWLQPGDPRLLRTIQWVWAFAAELAGQLPQPRGLRKFRTLEEANADRKHWENQNSRSLRRSRKSNSISSQP